MSQRKNSRFADVSIYDYANAKVAGKGRLSKAVVTPVVKVKKQTDSGWEQNQQNLDAGDAIDDLDLKRKTENLPRTEENSMPFLSLPLDIWYEIGDRIAPESVAVFASICKSTLTVTNSARFWFSLYKRYYKPSNLILLPKRLHPEIITQNIRELKASVIRTFFFIYPPFIERLKPRMHVECDLQPLVRRKCIGTWYTYQNKVWTYWFKLKIVNPRNRCLSLLSQNNKRLLRMERDVSANQEKHTKVLQVSTPFHFPLPAVQGHILKSASTTLTQNMMSNKVSLAFDSHFIVIDPATHIQILDWWHPQYPHVSLQDCLFSFGTSNRDKEGNDMEQVVLIDHWYDV